MTQGKTMGSGIHNASDTYTQLTAVGATESTSVKGMRMHTFQVTVAAINTNVSGQIEGSLDGTNFFVMPVQDFTATGISYTNEVATITANGTYLIYVEDVNVKDIRFNFTAETGGTSATLDVKYLGRS